MALDQPADLIGNKYEEVELPCSEFVIDEIHKLLWADPKIRSHIQENYGLSIIPSNFYSNVPSLKEVEESFEYREDGKFSQSLILFNNKIMLDVLNMLMQYVYEFNPPKQGNESACKDFFWENSQFSFSDAMAYYTFIRAYKPRKIVEIGSGFSTLIAIDAVNKNQTGSITCIEPFPRDFLETVNIDLVKKKVQDIASSDVAKILENGDFLFIDSTHTVKSGSDCLKIYLDLLPSIKKDIFIHVHDIFLPFAFPKSWVTDLHIYWTEQYLLLALLIDNPKIEILYGSAYHQEKNSALLEDFMGGKAIPGGSSFWFKYNGQSIP